MNIIPFEIVWALSWLLALGSIALAVYLYHRIRVKKQRFFVVEIEILVFVLLLLIILFAGRATTGHMSVPFFMKTQGPYQYGPELPLASAGSFFMHLQNFEQVADIAADPSMVPPPTNRNYSTNVVFVLEAKEVLGEIAKGITFNYWTINGTVPGPMLRARVGDNITIVLSNSMSAANHAHSIDFHATTGPGGGAKHLQVEAGETKSITFKALNPGLYIYHCASPDSVAVHSAHGQYGLILIEPEEGLPAVDREFYVVQGELFTRGRIGNTGLVAFDSNKMLDELPTYVVMNGRVKGLNGKMQVNVGDSVRIYFGNGGVAKTSSFHVIGEIFDTVYPEASIGGALYQNVQTTVVPAGGATIVDFVAEYPGDLVLVDHSLARVDRGAWGVLQVRGDADEQIYQSHQEESESAYDHG